MKVHTTTEHFNMPTHDLYNFLSSIENLKKWATGHCLDVKKEGNDYKIITPKGEMYQVFEKDKNTGVIDMFSGPSKDMMWCWPTRVVDDNMGGSIFIFTCIQMPEQSDEEFSMQCSGLDKEFGNIRNIIEDQRMAS